MPGRLSGTGMPTATKPSNSPRRGDEKQLSKPRWRIKKGALRHTECRIRGPHNSRRGATVTVAVRAGKRSGSGISIARFAGTSSAQTSSGPVSHGSQTCARRLDGPRHTPSRVQGMKMAPHGRSGSPRSHRVHSVDLEENRCSQRRDTRTEEPMLRCAGGEHAAAKAPLLDAAGKKSKEVTLEAEIVGAEVKRISSTNG